MNRAPNSLLNWLVALAIILSTVGFHARVRKQPVQAAPVRLAPRADLEAANPAGSGDALNVELVGQIGGPLIALAVQGSYAYLGVGPRLVILDVSDPGLPVVVGRTEVMPSVPGNLAVAGDYIYVTAGDAGLRIIEVSNPAAPTEIAFYNTPGAAMDVAVAGSYAYIVDGLGLRVVDVSNPANPVEAGFYDTPAYARRVAISGNYAYIADIPTGIRVVDISNPANPVEVGLYDLRPGNALDVTVAGNYAYVISGDLYGENLFVVDVSNPANPVETGFYNTLGDAADVAVAGGYAYVAAGPAGLQVVDVSDPANPVVVGIYDAPGYVWDVAVTGNDAYVNAGGNDLQVVDVSNPASPMEAGSYGVPGSSWNVAVAGHYAYITAGFYFGGSRSAGLWVVDIANPADPVDTGFYAMPVDTLGVAVAGHYAYLAANVAGLRIVDVSDPANPVETGFYDTPGYAWEVAVEGTFAYVADGPAGLRVVDISDPTKPVETGFYLTPGSALRVAVVGNYAYLAAADDGLRVIDISNPASPFETGFYNTPGSAQNLAVAEKYAYIGEYPNSLRLVDVSDPANPVESGSYETPGFITDVAADGNYVYVVDELSSLRIVDVSDPANLVEAGFYEMPGSAGNVSVAGSYVYLTGGSLGLVILRFTADTDADGLLDVWETQGLDRDGDGTIDIDLPAMGADPNHKDIFVEIDYMEDSHCSGSACVSTHSHRPSPEALALVVAAFEDAPVANPDGSGGIRLHVDIGPDTPMTSTESWGVYSHSNLLPDDPELNWTEFYALKDRFFNPARAGIFHYAVFAHHLEPDLNLGPCASGQAPRPGMDLIVSLAGWGAVPGEENCAPDFAGQIFVGTTFQQAGTFMHVLGHNLGLDHGGGDSLNAKPNYLSVMNYAFQSRGLIFEGMDRGTFDFARSDQVPALDEASLDEGVGLNGGVITAQYGTRWSCPDQEMAFTLAANDPINWNCTGGASESGVAANINDGWDPTPSPPDEILSPYFDWANLVFLGGEPPQPGLQTPQVSDPVYGRELTLEMDNQIADAYEVTLLGSGGALALPGYTTTYSITLLNTGENQDTYTLTATSSAGWADLTGVPVTVTLQSGESLTIGVETEIPGDAMPGGFDRLRIEAESLANPAVWTVSYLYVRVLSRLVFPIIQK